ncbi:MAG TPA: heavy metal translocating P-type ATPase [Gammaproteobacteria bacterium]|nr:heavy metal translocating P-type ATPase [Gammaproteobacteria bacterium]
MNNCFHCGEPVPKGEQRWLEIDGERRPFCCAGCEAVSKLILAAGMDDFYRFRTELSPRVEPADPARWQAFDSPDVLASFARLDGGVYEASLQLDDIRCAACGWLIEKTLGERDGVCDIRLNPVNGRAVLRWRQDEVPLSSLFASLDALGFRPRPLDGDATEARDEHERHGLLRRLAVAGFGMMQAMMYGIAMYLGIDMSAEFEHFFRHVSLLIATPVVFYAAAPFFRGALRAARGRTLGMDVPLSIAILIAYGASVVNAFRGSGEVYFDSVSMFVFFLLIGRYVEAVARHRVSDSARALGASLPASATRIRADGESEDVPLASLSNDDIVLVTRGSAVPADGVIVEGAAELDESLLTGEAHGVLRKPGDALAAGAINLGAPFRMRVVRTGNDTLIAGIARLLDRAQASRPRLARYADRLARRFVAAVLLAAGVTALAWAYLDPAQAFEITLSVLIVTCPCALGLAVPVALTAATNAITRRGVLTVNSDALEQLEGITDVVFDKTGTLTVGKPSIRRILINGAVSEDDCLALAAGLEMEANHPLARAFLERAPKRAVVSKVEQLPGEGLRGEHEGMNLRLGRPEFAAAGEAVPGEGSWIALADDNRVLAWFEVVDALREEAAHAIAELHAAGLRVHLLSGDSEDTVAAIARRLGIRHARGRQRPEDKLAVIEALHAEGARVLMIGDGINDAPVLGGADVSIAMAAGAELAQASADFVLTGSLRAIAPLLEHARRTRRIMRQNLAWAFSYNMLAVPLAAAGLVTPWMAAIGMSASSLLVTLNALRLNRVRDATDRDLPETLRELRSS